MIPPVDYSLYVITDSRLARGRSHLEVVGAAVRGGATVIQYREKDAPAREMIENALALLDLCRTHNVPLVINDRVDVALAVDADGVHVGQDDMPAAIARKLIGRNKIVGVSAANPDEARAAIADGADYLGVGAIFATGSKSDAGTSIGMPGLIQVARVSSVPVVGIAGINSSNAASVIRAGASGVAVISAVVGADNIEQAARELRTIVDQARRGTR